MSPAISKDKTPTWVFRMVGLLGVDGVARTESRLVDIAVFTLTSHVSRAIGSKEESDVNSIWKKEWWVLKKERKRERK